MYQLRPPPPELAPYVEHLWFVTPDAGPVDLQVDVFVDLRADLIFNFGAPYERTVHGGASRSIATSNLDAQRLVPIRIRQRGAVRVVGVRFRLGGLGAFDVPALKALTGTTPPPADVFGPMAHDLERALRDTVDVDDAARVLGDALLRVLRPDRPGFQRVFEALGRMVEADGQRAPSSVAEASGTSLRALERGFSTYVGATPRSVARVLRFQRAMRTLMRTVDVPLATVAASCGYFDQAHFVRDFRAMTGGVPRGYRGYYPESAPTDFAPNVVAFVQDGR